MSNVIKPDLDFPLKSMLVKKSGMKNSSGQLKADADLHVFSVMCLYPPG